MYGNRNLVGQRLGEAQKKRLIAICAQSRVTGRVAAWVLPIEVR
jgi:hypothetical protein